MDCISHKKILLVSANYPDSYHYWDPWNKRANLAISQLKNLEIEVIAPRPYIPPFKFFPYYETRKLPIKHEDEEGIVHHPRFIYPVPKKIFYRFTGGLYGYSVSNYIKNVFKKVDLIHAHHTYPDGYGLISYCKKNNVPLVVDIHGDSLIQHIKVKNTIGKKIKKTLDFSDGIVCISKKIFDSAKEVGLPEEKLSYIPLGVNIDLFKPRNKIKLKRKYGMNGKNVILFVGDLNVSKGVYYLLNAIQLLPDNIKKKTIFVFVGDGPEKLSLKKYAEKLSIVHNIRFEGRLNPVNGLSDWYSLADIFDLPSLSEGRPMVINEAMASECAIIASNISGIPEQVKDGYNGYLIEPKDYNALAEKIEFLLNNDTMLEMMCKNSRKRVLEKDWSWQGYAKKVYKVYNEILDIK